MSVKISGLASFTTSGGMRSGPVAFFGFRNLIILVTSFCVLCLNKKIDPGSNFSEFNARMISISIFIV